MTTIDDTIVALATAPGSGARGVVRLSGPDSIRIVGTFAACIPATRGLASVSLRLPDVHSPLAADVLVMPGPHSYTGQDCVEIHTISSPPILDHLITCLLNAGARAAGPGEFTLRAFLAGKKDLTQAEAVAATIEAGSNDELSLALTHLAGGVVMPLQGLREDLLNLLADVEAGLDFTEEDISFVDKRDTLLRLGKGMAQLINLQKQLASRSVEDRRFRIVIVGRPNTGKSSLFNALAGSQASIVSPTAGTTRDYVSRSISLRGTNVELIDTAGWQHAVDDIEDQAQSLGYEQAARADLVVRCIESTAFFTTECGLTTESTEMIVLTKCDLIAIESGHVATSAKSGAGIAELKKRLSEKAQAARHSALSPSLSRCRHHVDKSLSHLRTAHHVVLFDEPGELMALELRLALEQIGEMVGAIYSDDLLDRIFSRFCIGK